MSVDTSFEGFYAAEAAVVFQSVFLLCRDHVAAQDATQEAFARALERWGRLRDASWAGGWVTTTAVNVLRRSLRRRSPPPEPASSEPDLDESMDLWLAVRSLPLKQQQAVVLRYRADLSMDQIGAAMGCDPGTVRTHLQRARKALRARMGAIDARR